VPDAAADRAERTLPRRVILALDPTEATPMTMGNDPNKPEDDKPPTQPKPGQPQPGQPPR